MSLNTFHRSRFGIPSVTPIVGSTLVALGVATSMLYVLGSEDAQSRYLYTDQAKKDMPEKAKDFIRMKPTDYTELRETDKYIYIYKSEEKAYILRKIPGEKDEIYGWELLDQISEKGVWIFSDKTVRSVLSFGGGKNGFGFSSKI